MKLLGIQRVEGGVSIALPSGEHTLLALPKDTRRASYLLGERIFKLLDDESQPVAHVAPAAVDVSNVPASSDSIVVAINSGIEASRTIGEIWRTLRGAQ